MSINKKIKHRKANKTFLELSTYTSNIKFKYNIYYYLSTKFNCSDLYIIIVPSSLDFEQHDTYKLQRIPKI